MIVLIREYDEDEHEDEGEYFEVLMEVNREVEVRYISTAARIGSRTYRPSDGCLLPAACCLFPGVVGSAGRGWRAGCVGGVFLAVAE